MVCTIIWNQATPIFDEEVRQRAMDMRADLLPSLRCPKDPNDRDLEGMLALGSSIAWTKLGVKLRSNCLVMVDAIQPEAEKLHQELLPGLLTELVRDIIMTKNLHSVSIASLKSHS